MKLYVSGVELPKLFSLRDRVLRQFLLREAELEVKKQSFSVMQILMSGVSSRNQEEAVKRSWREYLGLMYGVEVPKLTQQEEAMKTYYENVVSKMRPKMWKSNKGGLVVGDLNLK
jgi:hypothetical protein